MDKETHDALWIILEDIAKDRRVHIDAYTKVNDWWLDHQPTTPEIKIGDTHTEDGRSYVHKKCICECGNEHLTEDILEDDNLN